MKLYTYKAADSAERLAVELQDKLYDLAEFDLHYADMNALIADSESFLRKNLDPAGKQPLQQPVKLCAPIPHPRQDVLCLGINYIEHAAESVRFDSEAFGGERPKAIYFSKRVHTASGDGDPIPSYPGLVSKLDYECELGVILGKDAFCVQPKDVADYIFGYTIVNDVSARDLQTSHKQWYFGKSLDGFTPCGPCIVTADEVPFPPALDIRCSVNGELRQNSNTSYMIRGIAEIISELSQGMTLCAGTIIASGTPSGVGMGFEPPRFLKPGDTIVCEIEKIGSLHNTVK